MMSREATTASRWVSAVALVVVSLPAACKHQDSGKIGTELSSESCCALPSRVVAITFTGDVKKDVALPLEVALPVLRRNLTLENRTNHRSKFCPAGTIWVHGQSASSEYKLLEAPTYLVCRRCGTFFKMDYDDQTRLLDLAAEVQGGRLSSTIPYPGSRPRKDPNKK